MAPPLLGILIVAFIIGTFVFARVLGNRMIGGSSDDEATIARLMSSGRKARATITSAAPTGLTVQNHHVQLSVDFWMEPLDGAPPFEATKKMFLLQTQFPRVGDTWPSWFDQQDPTLFCVAAPVELDPKQIPMYREFGLDHPLDSTP